MRMKNIFITAALLSLTISVFAGSDKKTNLALIADKTSSLDKSPLFSLLEVELSQKEGINLLERAAIDKILQEQQLSAAGLLDRNTAIKIGKLLRADAFIILSLENQTQDANDLIRIRVSETAHGLRLLDSFEQSNNKNQQEAVERIIQKIESVLTKIKQPDEKLIPVGIVDIHRIQLGEQYKMLERTLPTMLSVRLSLEPQIIMLEREDLKTLLDEKLMIEGEDTDFWSSAILIDGYIQPNNGQLELHLLLKQSNGDEIKSIIVPVEPNEAITAIEQASSEIIKNVQNSPPIAKWNPELEADEFYKQGKMLSDHGLYSEALNLFETAHALRFENVLYTEALFERLWTIRLNIEMKNNGRTYRSSDQSEEAYQQFNCPYSDLELAELVSIFIRQIHDGYEEGEYSAQYIYERWLKSGAILAFWPNPNNYFLSAASVSSEQVKSINRETRKIWLETCDKALKKEILLPDVGFMNNLIKANLTWISSDDPYELIENLKKAFNEFVMPPELGGQIKTEKERNIIYDRAFRNAAKGLTSMTVLRDLGDSLDLFLNLRRHFLVELTKVNDSVVRFNAYMDLGYLPSTKNVSEQDKSQAKAYTSEAIKILSENLVNSKIPFAQFPSSEISEIKDCLARFNIPPDDYLKIWLDFYKPLIEKKDAKILALCNPGFQAGRLVSNGNSDKIKIKWYQLLEQMAEILSTNSNDTKIITALSNVRDSQAQMKQHFPDIFDTQESTLNVTMLLNKKDWLVPIHSSVGITFDTLKAKLKGDMLWIGLLSESKLGQITSYATVCLAGINLRAEKLNTLYQADAPIKPGPSPTQLTSLEISNDAIYVSIKDGGIVEFPVSKAETKEYIGNPERYSPENGLPSMYISSIAMESDKLWVAYGERFHESGLGIYEPKTGKWESIFCSTLKGEPPFNSGTPYQIQNITFIAPDKFLFILNDPILGTSDIAKWLGLWEMNTNNHTTNHIDIGNGVLNSGRPVLGNFQNNWWIWSSNNSLMAEFNILSETHKYINWDPYKGHRSHDNRELTSAAIHNSTLWGQWGESQIIKIQVGKKLEDAEIIDNNLLDGEPVWKFVSTPHGLVGIGNGTIGLIETENVEK